MLLNQLRRLCQLFGFESVVGVKLHDRFNPELGLAVSVLDVNVGSRFLAREEVETVPANPKNRGTHPTRIAQLQATDPRRLTLSRQAVRLPWFGRSAGKK